MCNGRFILDDYIDLDQLSGGGVSALTITTDETNNTLKITATNTDESTIDSNVVDLSWLKGSSSDTTNFITSGKVTFIEPSEETKYQSQLRFTFANKDGEDKITINTILPASYVGAAFEDYTYTDTQYYKGWNGGPTLMSYRAYYDENGDRQVLVENLGISFFDSDTQSWNCTWTATGDVPAETGKPACYKYGFVHGYEKTDDHTEQIAVDETGAMWRTKDVTFIRGELTGLVAGAVITDAMLNVLINAILNDKFINMWYENIEDTADTLKETVSKIALGTTTATLYIYLTSDMSDYFEITSTGLVTHVPTTNNTGKLYFKLYEHN